MKKDRAYYINIIKKNIKDFGFHLYSIDGGPSPRYMYSIGGIGKLKHELVAAGCHYYSSRQLKHVFKYLFNNHEDTVYDRGVIYDIPEYGPFTLQKVHSSWVKILIFGALDYFELEDIDTMQIVPVGDNKTLDTPDMTIPWSEDHLNGWQWLEAPWRFSVPEDSVVVTNVSALKGQTITEVVRWEEGQWEMFAGHGPDLPKEELRHVSLGTMLGIDSSLIPSIDLKIEEGIWRPDLDSDWSLW